MGVIDNEFKRLQDVVTSLEDRVKRLEQRQSGGDAASSDSVRMILMGPPGAGTFFFFCVVQFSGISFPLLCFFSLAATAAVACFHYSGRVYAIAGSDIPVQPPECDGTKKLAAVTIYLYIYI